MTLIFTLTAFILGILINQMISDIEINKLKNKISLLKSELDFEKSVSQHLQKKAVKKINLDTILKKKISNQQKNKL